jgi:hypothetical protein
MEIDAAAIHGGGGQKVKGGGPGKRTSRESPAQERAQEERAKILCPQKGVADDVRRRTDRNARPVRLLTSAATKFRK